MPEEINRRLIDQLSDILFVPTTFDLNNLKKENLIKGKKIYKVGNTISDVIKKCKPALLIETDSEIKKIEKHLKKYRYGKYYFSNSKKQFFKIKKQYPLNTYFLQTRHLN